MRDQPPDPLPGDPTVEVAFTSLITFEQEGVGVDTVSGGRGGGVVPVHPGMTFKHYEIIREVGRGGMGRVFVARDLKLGRKVALKFMARPSAELTQRFLREARATARCSHENIVVIHEVDEHEGLLYMALELLEGAPLSRLMKSGPVAPARAVELMTPVVRALVRAHALEIVHRDLKPDNIFVTTTGAVKVLDFGIAKLFAREDSVTSRVPLVEPPPVPIATGSEGIIGTVLYMSPEQWGLDEVDYRADLWAVGVLLWELLTGSHPLAPTTKERLRLAANALDEPMPSIASAAPEVPPPLQRVIDRCLAKRKADRYASAAELLDHLGQPPHGRAGLHPADEIPYLGLRAFQEADAGRFFGRARDVQHVASRVRELPLVGLVGPSGVGKSSVVRAGLVPALRGSGEPWQVLITRPGRNPLASLAALIAPPGPSREGPPVETVDLLHREPGHLGALLRRRARSQGGRLLLFVDQFEEIYTLTADGEERRAFTSCLAAVADDPASPLRVVLSMRSDFLDRVAEERAFMSQLAPGLVFLPPPDAAGLREALVQPLDRVGFRFETTEMVDEIVASLQGTAGALPLLQFAAGILWETRDRVRRLLTRSSYDAMGGVAGALANHADQVVAGMSLRAQRLARAIFQRLVTTEGTRAIVDLTDIAGLTAEPGDIEATLDILVRARLLVVQNRADEAAAVVEIVHESLISRWPTLRRWLDEIQEDAAFLDQLRVAARQWEVKGRPAGLVWTGETAREAERFGGRYKGDVGAREREFLGAVVDRVARESRRRQHLVAGSFAFLVALVVAAAIALVWIRSAETAAREQRSLAERETVRARAAERSASEQLTVVGEKERDRLREMVKRYQAEEERRKAQAAATAANTEVMASREQLAQSNEQLEKALRRAREEADRASALAEAERTARQRTAELLAKERERVAELEKQRSKIVTELK